MTRQPTNVELRAIAQRVTNATLKGSERAAVQALVETFFEIPPPAKTGRRQSVTKKKLGRTLITAATTAKGSAENACRSTRRDHTGTRRTRRPDAPSPRSLWRYLRHDDLPQYMLALRTVWWTTFQIARRRFGLMRLGFEVYIDEHQTLVYTRERITEVGKLAGASKKDKYSGKFRALTYQVMVACFRGSRVVLPLDVFLTAKSDATQDPKLKIPSLSPQDAIARFVGLLEAAYPAPKLILFDRGYDSNVNFTRVTEYCNRYGSIYFTPARRSTGPFIDTDGKVYASVVDFAERNLATAKFLSRGSRIKYATGQRPITDDRVNRRNLVVFYRPREDDDEESGATPVGREFSAFLFYTNLDVTHANSAWAERLYSNRWTIENWFKKRAANFHGGRGQMAIRRVAVFMAGIAALAIYGLMQGHRYPEHDVVALSQGFSLPSFVADLTRPPPD